MKDMRKAGECPTCKSKNIEYGDGEPDNGGYYYECTCNNCKAIFREWYSLEYVKSELD